MVSSIIVLVLMQILSLEIVRSQVELQLPESYVVDIQHLIGGKNIGQPGVYGTKGEFSTQNIPGSRYSHSMCINPLNGNILVFGGSGHGRSKDSLGTLNDLWEYDTKFKRWKWISGSDTVNQPGYYGQLNVAAPENVPGARQEHAMVSDPSRKSVWLFGGTDFFGYHDDLWEWQSESGLWIWRSGNDRINQPPVYESNPQSGIQASPGARFGHAIVMHYETGTLVLFGGNGYDENGFNVLHNDLWYFRISVSRWYCMNRCKSVNDSAPPERYYHTLSMNQNKKTIFLFGGSQSLNAESYNDLWAWDMKQLKWNLLSALVVANQKSVGGDSRPGARYGHSMSIHEDTGQFVVFGGYGYDSDGLDGRLNDLWIYEPLMGWIWVSGNDTVDQSGIYQKPFRIGSRRWHTAVFSQNQKLFYVFGGETFNGRLNDLWTVDISITCPQTSAKFGFNCVPCKAGTVVDGDSCTPCPVGYFSADPADETCKPCPKNQYQSFKGQTACLNCPPNAACTLTEFHCLSGFTKNVNDATCITCPAGYWKPEIGNHKCTQCLNNVMVCEPSRCLLHNGRMCPLDTAYNFWIDNPSIGLIILSATFWNLFFIGFLVGLKEPWFYSFKTYSFSKSKSPEASVAIQSIQKQPTHSSTGFQSLVEASDVTAGSFSAV